MGVVIEKGYRIGVRFIWSALMDTWLGRQEGNPKIKEKQSCAYPARLASMPLTGGGESACPKRSRCGELAEILNGENAELPTVSNPYCDWIDRGNVAGPWLGICATEVV